MNSGLLTSYVVSGDHKHYWTQRDFGSFLILNSAIAWAIWDMASLVVGQRNWIMQS